MKIRFLLAASVASIAAAAAVPQAAQAQQITSGVQGTVTDANGSSVSNATVTVTDTRTGASRTQTTDTDGSFRFNSLVSGGPYTVTVTASGFEGQSVEEQYINITGNTDYSFELTSVAAGDAENVIVVSGARVNVQQLAVGPGIAFGQDTLESFPSITRDVRDIIRLDPRVSLNRSNEVDRISCLGGNDRSNTFTVDGVVQADVFGLNGTPFAARNALPLPFDVIRETSVEFAPFDVEYSDFTGCLVNVVTKSGANEFHGSAFFSYRDSGLRGTSLDGEDDIVSPFEEKRWGATLGGPIIPDRLFFYAGYEETDLGNANEEGPYGGGFANQFEYATQAQFDRFAQIARDVYGQDVGGYPITLPESSVRYFGRLDAYITDDHRIEGSYQRLEETNVESDFGDQETGGLNSFEDEGTVSDYYSLRFYSNWSDTVSTELRLSRSEVSDVQGPVGFGEAQSENPTVRLSVLVPNETSGDIPASENPQNGLLSTGPGIFRSANALENRTDQAKFQVNIDAGKHQLKFGAEYNDLEVYNLFAINATGTLFFASLDDFEAGRVAPGAFSSVFGGGADSVANGSLGGGDISATPSGDINEAAATFGRQIYSIYAQDKIQATPQLSLTAGVRMQIYDGDAPKENPEFVSRYGWSNAVPFSDLDVVWLPRASATYEFDNEGFLSNSRVTGGVGVFSGGDPVVYFSNAFSNNGFSTGQEDTFGPCDAITNPDGSISVVQGGQFTGFPDCARQAASLEAAAGLADTQSTDPEFDVPTVVRANLGLATDFGTQGGFFSNWHAKVDYIYSRFNDTLNFVDLSQTPNITQPHGGYTVDGRPIYAAIDPNRTDCNASLAYSGGTPPMWNNVTAECFGTGRDDEIQLTNGPSYESHVVSFLLAKNFDRGIFTEGGAVGLSFGYAFTDSENNRNVGSSTATSSYDVTSAFDRQNPAVSTSNYETRHNITASVYFKEQFVEDFDTSLGIFFRASEGRPYSLNFDGGGVFNDSSSGNDNALLYIPSGIDDPNLSPSSDIRAPGSNGVDDPGGAVNQLLDYLSGGSFTDSSGNVLYDGSYVPEQCDFDPGASIARNTCRNEWTYDLDLRFSQELPFLGSLTGIKNDRIELFADFDNFLNFLDDGANIERARDEFVDLVDGGVDAEGRYIITGFNPDDKEFVVTSASIWRIQVGVRYEF
ncbi:Oar-like outer membrane protein, OmpA family protein [Aurantiacibacter atlanticus]|uniref:Oar-like outer membrane protein, OmpA family protein n=1 Tax=Aurantiacibacter atlanticus TaxID=1648404 RepID=A0A0H4VAU0_9SPHN|nr:TonB-dependent receptor [Aurantiacibacter atlanticus]AKQ41702.1 Oar-like outer membrane protein, OmpA family protein [Aurantiacibacter atlanticus]